MPLYKFAIIFMILLFSISCTGKTATTPEPMIHQEAPMAQRETAVAMTDVMEMHHWLAYWAAKEKDAPKVNHHVSLALILATDPRHRSDLDGLIREHISEEQFIHTQKTLKEWLGGRPEPGMTPEKLEVKLALALLKEKR